MSPRFPFRSKTGVLGFDVQSLTMILEEAPIERLRACFATMASSPQTMSQCGFRHRGNGRIDAIAVRNVGLVADLQAIGEHVSHPNHVETPVGASLKEMPLTRGRCTR